jgi:hypothetical protein
MPCSGLRLTLRVGEIFTLLPSGCVCVEHIEIIKAVGMRSRSSKKKKLIVYIAKAHSSTRGWAFSFNSHA